MGPFLADWDVEGMAPWLATGALQPLRSTLSAEWHRVTVLQALQQLFTVTATRGRHMSEAACQARCSARPLVQRVQAPGSAATPAGSSYHKRQHHPLGVYRIMCVCGAYVLKNGGDRRH